MKGLGILGLPRKSCSFWLACYLTATGCVALETDGEVRDAIDQVKEERSKEIEAIDVALAQAEELVKAGQYAEADATFAENHYLVSVLMGLAAERRLAEVNKRRSEVIGQHANAVLADARKQMADEKFTDAINTANEAELIDPRVKDEVAAVVDMARRRILALEKEKMTSLEEAAPTLQDEREKVDLLFREAQILFKGGRYEEVRAKLEEIFIINPLYEPAIEMAKRNADTLYQRAKERHTANIYGQ